MMSEAIPVSRKCMEYIKGSLARAQAAGMSAEGFAIEDICHSLEAERWGEEEWKSVRLELHAIQQQYGGDARGPCYVEEQASRRSPDGGNHPA
jgi:hypothetical protein